MDGWPRTREELASAQRRLASTTPPPWEPPGDPFTIGAVFATFSTLEDPTPSERAWAAATAGEARSLVTAVVDIEYEAGFLALREGRLLERAVRALPDPPDVLLVNATGRDHPRGAGLALQLGAVLDLPTVGVTDRPLVAVPDRDGRLLVGGENVGHVVHTRRGARPVMAHAGWRTDAETARIVVLAATGSARTPEPLRRARFLARSQRARDEGRLPSGWQMDRLAEPRFPRG
jgi:deoxyribonuclease V